MREVNLLKIKENDSKLIRADFEFVINFLDNQSKGLYNDLTGAYDALKNFLEEENDKSHKNKFCVGRIKKRLTICLG